LAGIEPREGSNRRDPDRTFPTRMMPPGEEQQEKKESPNKNNVEERKCLHDAVLRLISLSGEARHFYWNLIRHRVGRKTFDLCIYSV